MYFNFDTHGTTYTWYYTGYEETDEYQTVIEVRARALFFIFIYVIILKVFSDIYNYLVYTICVLMLSIYIYTIMFIFKNVDMDYNSDRGLLAGALKQIDIGFKTILDSLKENLLYEVCLCVFVL